MKCINIFTDGGCSGNPGPGGWAYIIIVNGSRKSVSGRERETTNNRMELAAVIYSLKDINSHEKWNKSKIEVYTDSKYVQQGITSWIKNWEKNGWRTASKKPVKNKDLWMELKKVSQPLKVSWHWVKGHSNHELNEECDRMVKKEIKKQNIS